MDVEQLSNDIWEYLTHKYEKTRWEFSPLSELTCKFGQNISPALNHLFRQGKIKKRLGINGVLIEIRINGSEGSN